MELDEQVFSRFEADEPETEKTYDCLKQELLRRGKLYEDPDFPACPRSLHYKSEMPPDIVWRRPAQIVPNPVFVCHGATRFDFDQGELGNCWAVAAFATVAATDKKLLERAVPFDQSFSNDYAGIFRFRFWQYDKWVEVVVDDRLPTRHGKALIYARNREEPNEFWVALLEKAYAKLKGCYEALSGGVINDALVDMTGGISEIIDLNEEKPHPGEFYELMKKINTRSCLMGFGINNKHKSSVRESRMENGLFQGHAYSVTSLATIKYQTKEDHLIRLRNPHGQGEWNGEWGDSSQKWKILTDAQKKQLGMVIEEDGEFWITMEDVLLNFDIAHITHLTPGSFGVENSRHSKKHQWEVVSHRDSWVKGVSAGGCGNAPYKRHYWMNPQYKLTIDPDIHVGTVVISLTEVVNKGEKSNAINFDIYQLRPGARELLYDDYDRQALLLKSTKKTYTQYRECTSRHNLGPGKFVVIPSTFKPFVESEFVLRIFSEMKVSARSIDRATTTLSSAVDEDDIITKLFRKSMNEAGDINALELRDILSAARCIEWDECTGFTLECCRSLLTSADYKKKTGVIQLPELKKIWSNIVFWKKCYNTYDKNNDGKIDTYELAELYIAIGLSVGRGVLKSIVRRYSSREGKMTFEDLVLSTARLTHMMNVFKRYRLGGQDSILEAKELLEETLYI